MTDQTPVFIYFAIGRLGRGELIKYVLLSLK